METGCRRRSRQVAALLLFVRFKVRKGRLQFVEKNKKDSKTLILELTPEIEKQLNTYVDKIEDLLEQDTIPPVLNESKCKKCAYYEYCYI